ncbi:hypothetical protein AAFM79_19255 [Trichormus azollae HNT15244]
MFLIAQTPLTRTLKVQTLNDDPTDLIRMFRLWQQITGGSGLDLLKNFVKAKHGKIEIYSHHSSKELYQSKPTFFEGTLINITIRCDTNYC